MTNTFFEENTYYPIEKLVEYVRQDGCTHFALIDGAIHPVKIPAQSGDPVEPAPAALPLVCDFISGGHLQVGDVLLDTDGDNEIVKRIVSDDVADGCPIEAECSYSLNGWYWVTEDFEKESPHIIKITRDGKVVAEGNRYKDIP
jgi:hypothetical protein